MKLKALLAAGLLALPTAASAQQPSKDLVQVLMTWSALRADLPIPDFPPPIYLSDQCEMAKDLGHPTCDSVEVYGIHQGGIIQLHENWNANNMVDVSILVHELVHYAQYHARITGCREEPAYNAQWDFLAFIGIEPFSAMGMTPDEVQVKMRCEDYIGATTNVE